MLHALAQGQVSDHMSRWSHAQDIPYRKSCFCLQHATLWPYAHGYVRICRRGNWALYLPNDIIVAFRCGAKCFMRAEFCSCILLVQMVYFYLTEHCLGQSGDVLCKHFHLLGEAKTRAQLITNESLCMPFMHEGVCVLWSSVNFHNIYAFIEECP